MFGKNGLIRGFLLPETEKGQLGFYQKKIAKKLSQNPQQTAYGLAGCPVDAAYKRLAWAIISKHKLPDEDVAIERKIACQLYYRSTKKLKII